VYPLEQNPRPSRKAGWRAVPYSPCLIRVRLARSRGISHESCPFACSSQVAGTAVRRSRIVAIFRRLPIPYTKTPRNHAANKKQQLLISSMIYRNAQMRSSNQNKSKVIVWDEFPCFCLIIDRGSYCNLICRARFVPN